MAVGSDAGDLVGQASSGVENLASAATSALSHAGPAGALVQPLVTTLRDVWEGYFGVPIPAGTTNWNAYTHQQLYDMLWQGADVGDVGSVAAEWGRHSKALGDNADSLRAQQSALADNWSGQAAGPAGERLGRLSTHTSGIGTRAATVQQATQHAGDALAVARNTMPPPPGDPTGLVLAGAAGGAGLGAAVGAVLGAGAGGVGAGPGALMGAAIGAVAGGGGSLFLANVAAAEEKAQAVHVMQTYEASLTHSSNVLAGATNGATSAGSGSTVLSAYAGGLPGGSGGSGTGVPWNQLVGTSPLSRGSGAGGPGALAGAFEPQPMGRTGMPFEELAGEAATGSDMAPGAGAGRGMRRDEDAEHENRLPTIDHRLFDFDDAATPPVIG